MSFREMFDKMFVEAAELTDNILNDKELTDKVFLDLNYTYDIDEILSYKIMKKTKTELGNILSITVKFRYQGSKYKNAYIIVLENNHKKFFVDDTKINVLKNLDNLN